MKIIRPALAVFCKTLGIMHAEDMIGKSKVTKLDDTLRLPNTGGYKIAILNKKMILVVLPAKGRHSELKQEQRSRTQQLALFSFRTVTSPCKSHPPVGISMIA